MSAASRWPSVDRATTSCAEVLLLDRHVDERRGSSPRLTILGVVRDADHRQRPCRPAAPGSRCHASAPCRSRSCRATICRAAVSLTITTDGAPPRSASVKSRPLTSAHLHRREIARRDDVPVGVEPAALPGRRRGAPGTVRPPRPIRPSPSGTIAASVARLERRAARARARSSCCAKTRTGLARVAAEREIERTPARRRADRSRDRCRSRAAARARTARRRRRARC